MCGSVRLDYSCCGGAKVTVGIEGVSVRGQVSDMKSGKRLVELIVNGGLKPKGAGHG